MLEFHAEVPQVIASEGLAQRPYMAARAGFEPTTLQTKGDESTNEPPRPTIPHLLLFMHLFVGLAFTVPSVLAFPGGALHC